MIELTGKKVLLTGAASGIGRALAIQLAEQGAQLYLLDCKEDGLLGLTATLNQQFDADIRCLVCDLVWQAPLLHAVFCSLAGRLSALAWT